MQLDRFIKRRGLFLVPCLLLGIDYFPAPVLFNGCSEQHLFTLTDLVQQQSVSLGSLAGSRFNASMDDIASDAPLFPYATKGRTGLVVSADLTHQGTITMQLAAVAIDRLRRADAKAATSLSNLLLTNHMPSGEVQKQQLQLGTGKEEFPVDYLYVVSLDYNSAVYGNDGKEAKVKDGLSKVFDEAAKDGIENLIIPCIGVLPGEPKALQFEQFFPILLEAKKASSTPRNIYLSLYRLWPAPVRATAVQEIGQAWQARCESSSKESVLVHENPRILLLAISLCLLVSSFWVPLTGMNFLKIFLSFAGTGFAALSFMDFFIGAYTSQLRMDLHIVVLMVLAGLFPVLASINPKKIFASDEG